MRSFWSRALLFICSCFVIQFLEIHFYSKTKDNSKSDAAIVLGAAVWYNKPSPVFAERINHAITLYQKGLVRKIIFTGGFFNNSTSSESQIAKIYAEKKGVQKDDIYIEEKSKNTKENLIYAREILQRHKLNKVLLVSDPLHMKRAMLIAKGLDIKAKSSPTTTSRFKSKKEKLKFLLSETLFTISYRIRHVVQKDN